MLLAALGATLWIAAGVRAQPAQAAADCGSSLGPAVRRIQHAGLTLAWNAQAQPIPLDRHFQLDIVICGGLVDSLRVDADMPAHRHGMNYRAMVDRTAADRFRARGLLFHMAGRWRLIFDLDRGDQRLRLVDELDLR
jgi:hypothetical protein